MSGRMLSLKHSEILRKTDKYMNWLLIGLFLALIALVIITDDGGPSSGYQQNTQFSQDLFRTMQAPCAALPESIAYLEACTADLGEEGDGPLSCPLIKPVGIAVEPQTAALARTLTKMLKDRQTSAGCQPLIPPSAPLESTE
ncbi:MAG: hypothetical protein CMK09_04200 [Ponticaulis sp.]|nr:hypothetical protein [Ponticaulis sp.]|tara:strand:- start:13134 stop:13559 length:426 start_codon:yes stop_codon:yes gene_type:complete